jgi:hypothetical protein
VIDAMEGRAVAVVDVPVAFMLADMDSVVHVRFTNKMVDLLVEIDKDAYKPYVTLEGKDRVFYVPLIKALYGTIRAARLFWYKFSRNLQEWGFVQNGYDSFVVNKMVNGQELTVVSYVVDLKVSHKHEYVNDEFWQQLDEEFGKETPMNKIRGKIHNYMSDYVKMVLQELPNYMIGSAKTPATNNLIDVNI